MDPFCSQLNIVDPVLLLGEYVCASDSLVYNSVSTLILKALWGTEVAFLALIVLYGCIEIYIAWNLPSQTNQSKWILFSLYNVILTGAVCLPVISLVETERDVAIVSIVGQTFLYFQMQVSYLVPSFYNGIYRSTHSTGSGSSANGAHSQTLSHKKGSKYQNK